MSSLSELPSLREEINRKTFETIEWLFLGLNNGKLSEEQFSTGVDALFMAVAGLVDEGFIQMITEAQNMSDSKFAKRRLFRAPKVDEVLTLSWIPGEDRVIVSKRIAGIATNGTVKEFANSKDASEYMRSVGASMERRGWVEL
jgi:hypothetical protein